MLKVNNYDTRTTSHIVLYGTIIALKLFYILSVTTKDIKMCVCKMHVRWGYTGTDQLFCKAWN